MDTYAVVRRSAGSRPGLVARAMPDNDPRALVRAKSLGMLKHCVQGLREVVDAPFGQRRPFWVVATGTEEFVFLGYMAHRRAAMELVAKTPQFKSFDVIGYDDRTSILDQFDLLMRRAQLAESTASEIS